MLTIFKKLFAKSTAPAAPSPQAQPFASMPRVVSVPQQSADSKQPMAQVQVAHLSLAAILSKLPEDLRINVANAPDPSVTVALPLATIQKQLPTGSVKMSLASLYRQAPAGTFSQARVEEKRMVEVPLSEVLRHVNTQTLRRRPDQRRVEVPEDAPQLFGDKENPYAMRPAASPATPRPPVAPLGFRPSENLAPRPPATAPTPAPAPRMNPERAAAPAAKSSAPAPIAQASGDGVVLISLTDLCASWPEPIRSEAAALDGCRVALPAAAVSAGLAKGKVTFNWGQIRSWLTPAPEHGTEAREGTDLLLPLKVVAPIFLQSRPATTRKTVDLAGDIPALFSGGTPPVAPVKPVVEPAPEAPAPPAASAPAASQPEMRLVPPIIEPAPVELQKMEAPAVPAPAATPDLSALFQQPEKTHWSPPELIKATAHLPGVAGAIMALKEGLVVAAELPESLKADTVAAFLPQMFARLNTYSVEMELGDIEDLLFTIKGAHFQVYRIGEIYFAVIGHPGSTLPWEAMRLVVAELTRQNSK